MSEVFKTIITGDEQFNRTMLGIVQFSKRPRSAMRDMAAVLEDQTEQNFAAQGRPKWEPLAESTKLKRIGGSRGFKKNGALTKRSQRVLAQMKILQETGLMAGSVHSQYGDDYSMISASRPQARIQQLGGETGKGHNTIIEARPYLPFTPDLKLQPEAEKELLKTGLEHLQRVANPK